MRVMESCTLYIEDPLFHTLFSKETGPRLMGHPLSLFRLYMVNPSELADIWQVIIWLDIVALHDSLGLGAGVLEVLSKSGIGSELGHQVYKVL